MQEMHYLVVYRGCVTRVDLSPECQYARLYCRFRSRHANVELLIRASNVTIP